MSQARIYGKKRSPLGVESKVTLTSCTIFLASRRKCCNELQAAARLAFEQLPPIPSLLHSSFFALSQLLSDLSAAAVVCVCELMLAIRETCAQASLRQADPRAFMKQHLSHTHSILAAAALFFRITKGVTTRMSIISNCSGWT